MHALKDKGLGASEIARQLNIARASVYRVLPLSPTAGQSLAGTRALGLNEKPDLKLSPSEKGTLQKIAEGEYHLREFDWVALQHLKKLALAEDRPSGVVITKEGRRVLRRLTLPG